MCCANRYDHHCKCPFDHFLTCYTCIKPSPDLLIKWLRDWMEETRFAHKNQITLWSSTRNMFPTSLSLHINSSPEQNLSQWYLHNLLHLTPIKSANSYLKTKRLTIKLHTREPYYWTCLVTGTLLENIYTHWHYLQHLQYLLHNSVRFHPNTSENINCTLQLQTFPATTHYNL